MRCEKGVVTAGTTNGNTSVVALNNFSDSEPLRAIMVWAAYNTGAGTVADARFSVGFGTNDGGSIQQVGEAIYDKGSGVAAGDTVEAMNSTWILRGFSDATPTLDFEIDLTAFSDTGFTLTYTDAPASAIKIHYFAIGGSDVTGGRCGLTGLTTGTGAQDITVAASWGQPKLVLGLYSRKNSAGDGNAGTNGAQIGLGAATSDTVRQASTLMSRDATTASEVGLWQKARLGLALNNNISYSEIDLGAVAGFPTDGFEVNKVVHPAATVQFGWLALKGTFQAAIGVDTALTAGSTDDLAAGFFPAGAILWGTNIAATAGTINTTNADLGQFFIGGFDGTREGLASWINDDANLNPVTFSQHSETKIIQYYTPVTPTLVSECNASFTDTNLRLTWNDLDTVAREYCYLILGPNTARVPYRSPMPQLLAH